MSFKREGDDRSLLNVWKKRRITDLFSENIPEDEVAILKDDVEKFNREKDYLRKQIDDRIQTTLEQGGDITELKRKKILLNSPSTIKSACKSSQLGTKHQPKLKISLSSTSKDVQAQKRTEPNTATREKCLSAVTKTKKSSLPCYREISEKKRYADLRSNGWIQNSDGTWEKDQDVEFDSDEETPT